MTPTPKPTPAPEVPEELLAQLRGDIFLNASAEKWYRSVAVQIVNWAWAQRDEEVRLARQEGANKELEACCKWLQLSIAINRPVTVAALRAARRPSPPTLREQALAVLNAAPGSDYPSPTTVLTAEQHALIREALMQLKGTDVYGEALETCKEDQ